MLILIAVLMLSRAATAQVRASQTTDGTVHSLPDDHNQGEWVEFTHTLDPDPQTLHLAKKYSQNYSTLWGVEKYAAPFVQDAASYDMFGDGRDGVMPSSGNLDYNNGFGVGAVSGSAGSTSISVVDQYAVGRINLGDYVLIHQTRGTGAGNWELNKAASDFTGSGTFSLVNPLAHSYITSGYQHKTQIVRVPQYSNCSVTGTVTPLISWNSTVGGIFAVMCSGTLNVSGAISADYYGFRGGDSGNGYATDQWQGEGILCNRSDPSHYCKTPDTYAIDQGGGAADQIGGGGGGGGYSSGNSGDNIGGSTWGQGGFGYGAPDLSTMFFGGGGGGGATSMNPGTGYSQSGRGGGLIYIFARQVTTSGQVTAYGQQASGVMYDDGTNRRVTAGSGGGGQIFMRVGSVDLGTNGAIATGGPQLVPPSGGTGRFGGGAGGNGRIRIEYCDTFSGSANPPASVAKINCYGTVAGKVFRDDNGNGVQDASEPGLTGVTVSLSGVGQTATGGDGSYIFTANAPANYTVSATPPAGYDCTTPCNVDIALQVDQTITVNFGLQFSPTPTPTATPTATPTPTVTPTATAIKGYLPLVLRDYVAYFEGPWEVEPNNTYLQANGSLRSGRDYYGYPNDQKDYFSIYLRTGGQIVIDLSNHTGQGVQLQLFYQTAGNLVAGDLDAPYHIEYTGPAGLYYIYIYTAGNYNSSTAFALRATYP